MIFLFYFYFDVPTSPFLKIKTMKHSFKKVNKLMIQIKIKWKQVQRWKIVTDNQKKRFKKNVVVNTHRESTTNWSFSIFFFETDAGSTWQIEWKKRGVGKRQSHKRIQNQHWKKRIEWRGKQKQKISCNATGEKFACANAAVSFIYFS